MTNVDPPDEIPPNWESTFRGQYRDCVNERVTQFQEEEEEAYREKLGKQIIEDKRHRELINLCVFPFVEAQPMEYEFLRADPLTELGIPNFDFLLYDFSGHIIFGEVKASIGEGWESQCVSDVVEQRDAVEANEDYIADEYLGGEEIRNKEYVLAVFSPDANRVTQEIVSERENIVTWRVHQMDKRLEVNTAAPPRENWVDDPDEYYEIVQHDHGALNSTLSNLESSSECFDLFPESHPITELRALISACNKVSGGCFVNEEELHRSVGNDLYYLSEEYQQDITESIIELGIETGYLKEWHEIEGDFKIVSRYTHSDGLEKTLTRKWIAYKVDQQIDARRSECWDKVRDTILEKSKAQTTLKDFP